MTREQRTIQTLERRVEELERALAAKEEALACRFEELAVLTRKLQERPSRLRDGNPFPVRPWYARWYSGVKRRIPRRNVDRIKECSLFDAEWYLEQYPELKKDRLALSNSALHYLKKGGFEGLNPSPFFDSAWYLNRNPDVKASGLNPLLHYIVSGSDEGRAPKPVGSSPKRQTGQVNIMFGAALLAVCASFLILVEGFLGGTGAEANVVHDEKFTEQAWRSTPIADVQGYELESWPGTLYCEPWSRWPEFEREKHVMVGGSFVGLEEGETDAFAEATEGGRVVPKAMSERFEWWRGEIDDDVVRMEGWYTAGSDSVKRLSMTGTLEEGRLKVEGERGPRDCTYEATAPS